MAQKLKKIFWAKLIIHLKSNVTGKKYCKYSILPTKKGEIGLVE